MAFNKGEFSEGDRAIIKEIAWEVGEELSRRFKEDVATQIELHTTRCEAQKFGGFKTAISAIIGGAIIAVFDWLIRK
jgi:hypothetical protein